MERTSIADLAGKVGEAVSISGWVDVRRDQGKLIFLDFRDETGRVQGVVLPSATDAHEAGSRVRPEWVVRVSGKVNARPERNVKPGELNGAIELEVADIEVLSEAQTPPFDVRGDGREIGEEVRLSKRYLDLRRPRLQANIRRRAEVALFARNFLAAERFVEIETPLLGKATPEGARDYLVPSRRDPGYVYALPQAPQQYKQLLMTAGFERYFQFARCMRDEDTRGDRQPEFTQLDMEMAFVEAEDVISLNERLLIALVAAVVPQMRIQQVPFPRFTHAEAMEKFGSDKPDLRESKEDPNLLAFCWIVDFPFFEKTEKGSWTFTHNPFSAPKPEHMAWLMAGERIGEILTTQYDIALNGSEIGGGSIRNHTPEALTKVLEIMGSTPEQIQASFGHMLDAFSHGAPPHGGIAWGFDRLMTVLCNEPSIREVIAFAKTGEGRDLTTGAPALATAEQLRDLGLERRQGKA
ncbi:MAG TPA: amino acid--tRNA ligase-related protein [Candidatus Paceibacterota bacterium]